MSSGMASSRGMNTSRGYPQPQWVSSKMGEILKDHNVYVGGGSMGKGLRRAARHFLHSKASLERAQATVSMLPGADLEVFPEEPFYIVDLGVVVSQFAQWMRLLPRVEPFYAVKCNPDPIIIRTLATLGANFDCASRAEIRLVQDVAEKLKTEHKPEIIYANPCKQRSHIIEAVSRGVTMVTFDNEFEIKKCAGVSKDIKLVLRIITDDSGSLCRFSTKFGASRQKWRPLLQCAKEEGLEVVGVSFHVGSGCTDANKYDLALADARAVFDMGIKDFGFNMHIVDIGGGFPGETHSMWNPMKRDASTGSADDVALVDDEEEEEDAEKKFMFFRDIADHVAPALDKYFPPDGNVRIIGEPGRYMVAASTALITCITSVRCNLVGDAKPEAIDDNEASKALAGLTRDEEDDIVRDQTNEQPVIDSIISGMKDYARTVASRHLAQQEVDTLNDYDDSTTSDPLQGGLLAPPEERYTNGHIAKSHHTAEGLPAGLVENAMAEDGDETDAMLSIAAAGEAAVAGVIKQAVADSGPLQDDFAYYTNDGVYGAFNNIMFDHQSVRPRHLARAFQAPSTSVITKNGFSYLTDPSWTTRHDDSDDDSQDKQKLYASTIWGPTCDSIDVIARSVLLPELKAGQWLYFQNMGAYTSAAASAFNGFSQTEKFYVCSVLPEAFDNLAQKLSESRG